MNLYGYAGGDPVNYSDPFGLCKTPTGEYRKCTVYSTGGSLAALRPEARKSLVYLAQLADHDLGVSATTNGRHSDPRHNGAMAGLAVDINQIDGVDVGDADLGINAIAVTRARAVAQAAEALASVEKVIAPDRFLVTRRKQGFGSARDAVPGYGPGHDTWAQHQDHLHVAFFSTEERVKKPEEQ